MIKGILCCCLLLCFVAAKSESGTSDGFHLVDLRAGAGIVTAPAVLEGIGTAVAESIVDPDFQSVAIDGDIAYSVSALFLPDSRFSFGMDVVFDRTTLLYEFATPELDESYETEYISLMARMDFKYIKKGPFKLYSSIGIGLCSRSVDQTLPSTEISDKNFGGALQLTPVGIRVGNRLAFWAELGFGYRGALAGGLALKL